MRKKLVVKELFHWVVACVCAASCLPAVVSADESLNDFNVTLNSESVEYDGESHSFFVEVKNNAGKVLTEGTDYTISLVSGQADVKKTVVAKEKKIILEPEYFEDTVTYLYTKISSFEHRTGPVDQYGNSHEVLIEYSDEIDEETGKQLRYLILDDDPYKYKYGGWGGALDYYNDLPPKKKGVYYDYTHWQCPVCCADLTLVADTEDLFRQHLDNCHSGNWVSHDCYGIYKHIPAKTKTIPAVYKTSFHVVSAGKREIRIDGIGKYSGSIRKTFFVKPLDIKKVNITGITTKYYNGAAAEQDAILTYHNKAFSRNKDYKVSYKNNVKVGTASMTFKGIGNLSGSITKTFSILEKADMNKLRSRIDQEIWKRVPQTASSIEAGHYPRWSNFRTLALRHTGNTNSSVSLKWNKVPGASVYALCGSEVGKKLKSIGIVNSLSITRRGLDSGKYYRFAVFAFNGSGKVLASSKFVYICTGGSGWSNYKKLVFRNNINTIGLNTYGVFLYDVEAYKKQSDVKIHRKISVESTDQSVAVAWPTRIKVGNKMRNVIKVKSVSKGTCYIYVYLQNGVCAKRKIRVE